MNSLLAIVIRTVVIWAVPLGVWQVLDTQDTDIGGAALGIVFAMLVALGWSAYDVQHHLPDATRLRWALVAGLFAVVTVTKAWIQDGFDPGLPVVAVIVTLIVLVPAVIGSAIGDRRIVLR